MPLAPNTTTTATTILPKGTVGGLFSGPHSDMPSPWLASNRDYDSSMYLKSPLTTLGAGNAYSPGMQFGWSPTTTAFFQRRNGVSPWPTSGNPMDVAPTNIHKDYSMLGDSAAPAPLSARGLASVRRGAPSMVPSLLDGPLTPSMYLSNGEQPHGLGGLNLNHVVTDSESVHHHADAPGVNGATSMHTDVQTPSTWTSASHQYRSSTSNGYGSMYTPGHWDNNKTPTVASTNGVHVKMSPCAPSWTANQIQPDLATAGSYPPRTLMDCKRGDKTPIAMAKEGDGGHAARPLSTLKPNGCLRPTSYSLLGPHSSLLSQQRPYSPRDSMSLTTPSRLNGTDDSVLPPLRSGGLSWFLNDWSNPLHPFKPGASAAEGLNNDTSMTNNNNHTVVFTPGGTLRESNCANIVVAPTTSTAAGALSSHHLSSVVMGKPPLSARAPRQPRNSMSKASSPYSGGTGGSSGFSTQEEKSSDEHSPSDMDISPQQSSAHPMRGFTNLPGLALHLPGPDAILKGGVRPMSPICSSIRSDESYETEEARWVAVQRRDSRASAAFFYCVLSTKIFCRTTCPSRHPVRENIIFVKTAAEASSQGYRACRRCKPDLEGGDPHEERQEALIAKVKERLYASVAASGKGKTIKGQGLKYIAEDLGVSHWHLHRCFKKRVGTTPEAWAKLQAKKIRSSLGRQGRYAHGGSAVSASYPGSTPYLSHQHHAHHRAHHHSMTPTTSSLNLSPTPMAPSPEMKPLELSSRVIKTDPMMVMTMMSGGGGASASTSSTPSVPLTSSPIPISSYNNTVPAFPFPCSSYGSTTSSSSSFASTTSTSSYSAFSPSCSSP